MLAILPRFSEAQTTQTWGGGSGQWDTGSTADWTGNTTWSGGYDNGNFTSTPGTITVSGSGSGGPVTFDTLTFGGTGPWLIQGAGIEKTPFSTSPVESTQVYTVNSGTGNVTINSTLTIGDIGVNHHAYITDDSTSAFSEGNINFTTYTANPSDTNTRSLDFNLNNTTGSISLTGTYTTTDGDAGGQGAFYFGDQALNVQANYYLTSTADFTNFDADSYHGNDAIQLDSGNLHIATSKFSTSGTQKLAIVGNANNNQTVDIEGAQTIGLGIYDSMKNSGTKATDGVSIYGEAIVNQNTANASTWSGNVVQDGTNLTLSAVSGGRLTVSGQLQNSTPQGLTIAGSGTVVLSSSTGNSYNENDGNGHLQPTTNASATLETGSTTLITNTSGSAFGTTTNGDATYNNAGSHNFQVNLQAGATLGGTGISKQEIVAQGATSTITAGDPGQKSLGFNPTIGTLTLAGGLTTTGTNGLTFDFKLDGLGTTAGVDSDLLSISNLTLNGTVDVNFTSLDGSVVTGQAYTLAYGSGTWSGTPTFDITTPAGYVLDKSYNGTGYDFDTGGDSFSVQFALAPEPSVLAMFGLSLLLVVTVARWMRHGPIEDVEEKASRR